MSLLPPISAAPHEPKLPRRFPWSTFGRPESAEEFLSKWRLERSSSAYVPGLPTVSWVLTSPLAQNDPNLNTWSVESLATQSYPKVEVIVAGDSTPETTAANFRVSPGVGTFAERANRAARMAEGEWIGFLEGNLLPSPIASFQLLREAVASPRGKLVYANEARVDAKKLKMLGWLGKPRASWYTLVHFNYIGWCWIVRKETFLALGGFQELSADEAVHDFLLRFFEKEDAALCAHATLFYRFQDKVPAYGAEFRQSLSERLRAKGLSAILDWSSDKDGDHVAITPVPKVRPAVSVITCFRDKSEWTIRCLDALEAQEGVDLDIILVDNDSSPEHRERIEARLAHFKHPARLVSHEGPFHFARMNNQAVRQYAKYPLIFLLNNDVYLKTSDAIFRAAAWAELPDVGTVGIRLCYPDGRVQHEGIRAAAGGPGRMVQVGHFPNVHRLSLETREVFANTFAACCFRREVFEKAGGLCELNWVNGFGDVAFQLGCLERGYRQIYLGGVKGTHQESGSRGLAYEYWEEMTLELRYSEFLKRMVREDLAWHPVEGPGKMALGVVRQTASWFLRAAAPELAVPLKRRLNALKRRFTMESNGLD